MNTPKVQVYRKSFFETRLAFRRFWAEEPLHSENRLAEMCYLYRRTLWSTMEGRFGRHIYTPTVIIFPSIVV